MDHTKTDPPKASNHRGLPLLSNFTFKPGVGRVYRRAEDILAELQKVGKPGLRVRWDRLYALIDGQPYHLQTSDALIAWAMRHADLCWAVGELKHPINGKSDLTAVSEQIFFDFCLQNAPLLDARAVVPYG